MAIKYCQFAFGKLLLIVLFLSADRWSSQSAEASPPGITFDDVSSEDYSSVLGEQEPTKPDDVDNEAIYLLNLSNDLNYKGDPIIGGQFLEQGKCFWRK
jgi:hypothetical protein